MDVDTNGDCDCTDSGGSHRYRYLQDANYNVVGLWDQQAGCLLERYEYDAYGTGRVYRAYDAAAAGEVGNVVGASLAVGGGNPIRYGGYYFDDETGLYHVRHRMYSPGLQRWLQRDPAGYINGPHLYGYVLGNPMGFLDPFGLERDEVPLWARVVLGGTGGESKWPVLDYGPAHDKVVRGADIVATGSLVLAGGIWAAPVLAAEAGSMMMPWAAWWGAQRLAPAMPVGPALPGETAALGELVGKIEGEAPAIEPGIARVVEDPCSSLGQLFRRGECAKPNGWPGNFVKGVDWSQYNPLTTPNYVNTMGLPLGNSSPTPDWVAGGRLLPGAGGISVGAAPGIGNNAGGGIEITVGGNGIILDWFHMPSK